MLVISTFFGCGTDLMLFLEVLLNKWTDIQVGSRKSKFMPIVLTSCLVWHLFRMLLTLGGGARECYFILPCMLYEPVWWAWLYKMTFCTEDGIGEIILPNLAGNHEKNRLSCPFIAPRSRHTRRGKDWRRGLVKSQAGLFWHSCFFWPRATSLN